MVRNEYRWGLSQHAEIEPHSLAKHELLRAYLLNYVYARCVDPQVSRLGLTLVDGFCGGGRYRKAGTNVVVPGSPLIMINAMKEAERRLNETRKSQFTIDARYHFIDKDPSALESLASELQADGILPDMEDAIHLRQGKFEDVADEVLAAIRRRNRHPEHPIIFVLDQYGWSSVTFTRLRSLFTLFPKAEVFLTFLVEPLIRYLNEDAPQSVERVLGAEATAMLLEAKGDDEESGRRLAVLLWETVLRHSGARFIVPFFARSQKANSSYWLLHLSNDPKARDVMTQVTWDTHNCSRHYGRPGLKMLGFDPRHPTQDALLPFAFTGDDKLRSVDALCLDLPKHLDVLSDYVSVSDLYRDICNETPATLSILIESLRKLADGREIDVTTANGNQPRTGESRLGIAHKVRTTRSRFLFDLGRKSKI